MYRKEWGCEKELYRGRIVVGGSGRSSSRYRKALFWEFPPPMVFLFLLSQVGTRGPCPANSGTHTHRKRNVGVVVEQVEGVRRSAKE